MISKAVFRSTPDLVLHSMYGGDLGEVGDEEVVETWGKGFAADIGAKAKEGDDSEGGAVAGGEKARGDVELVVDEGGDGKPARDEVGAEDIAHIPEMKGNAR